MGPDHVRVGKGIHNAIAPKHPIGRARALGRLCVGGFDDLNQI